MKKGLIFDMDGTLWDSSENVAASWNEKLKALGYTDISITKSDIMSVMGLTMDKIADIIFKGFSQEKRMELLEECCENENRYLREHGGILYSDLEKTFIRLKEEYSLLQENPVCIKNSPANASLCARRAQDSLCDDVPLRQNATTYYLKSREFCVRY